MIVLNSCHYVGRTNKYVSITFQSANKILCTFLDQQIRDQSTMSCDVTYGPCQQELTEISRGKITATANTVNIAIYPQTSEYCYMVNASNGTFTVLIEGEITTSTGEFMRNLNSVPAWCYSGLLILVELCMHALN